MLQKQQHTKRNMQSKKHQIYTHTFGVSKAAEMTAENQLLKWGME